MLNLYKSSQNVCYPVIIGDYVEGNSNRLGGSEPQGVSPGDLSFFMTLALEREPDLDVSIFISQDFDFFYENRNKIIDQSSSGVKFVVHEPKSPASDVATRAMLSMHTLYVGSEDYDSNSLDEIWTHHKIGGYPFFNVQNSDTESYINDRIRSGFFHIIQLAFPDSDDGPVEGAWPFHDSIFHVFGKQNSAGDYEFFVVWG